MNVAGHTIRPDIAICTYSHYTLVRNPVDPYFTGLINELSYSCIEPRTVARVIVILECHLQNCQFSDINYPLSFG